MDQVNISWLCYQDVLNRPLQFTSDVRHRHSQHSTCWPIVQFTKGGESETTSVASTGPLQFTNDGETETLTVFRYTDKIISLSMVKRQRHSPCSICWHISQFTKWWRERDTVLHLLTYSTVLQMVRRKRHSAPFVDIFYSSPNGEEKETQCSICWHICLLYTSPSPRD